MFDTVFDSVCLTLYALQVLRCQINFSRLEVLSDVQKLDGGEGKDTNYYIKICQVFVRINVKLGFNFNVILGVSVRALLKPGKHLLSFQMMKPLSIKIFIFFIHIIY